MAKKMYSAFVSSVFNSLKAERGEAIDCLLDNFIFPVCMEHFTAPTNKNLEHLHKLIDAADFVVLLLGSEYGSTDEENISWTQREYEYSVANNIDVVAIACRALVENLDLPDEKIAALPERQRRQVEFARRIQAPKRQDDSSSIKDIITRYLSSANTDSFAGWERGVSAKAEKEAREAFKRQYARFDLQGRWYHVHMTDDDPSYLRIGTAEVTQEFTPDEYHCLEFNASNYNAYLEDGEIKEDQMTRSTWSGRYTMDRNGSLEGMYNSTRANNRVYMGGSLPRGGTGGVHRFSINESGDIEGTFADEAPSPKNGSVFFFRDRSKRDAFVKKYRPDALKNR